MAVVSAGYSTFLSSPYFERINDDDDDDSGGSVHNARTDWARTVPVFAAANQVVTPTRVTNERVV